MSRATSALIAAALSAAAPSAVSAAANLQFAYAVDAYTFATKCDLAQPLVWVNIVLSNPGDEPAAAAGNQAEHVLRPVLRHLLDDPQDRSGPHVEAPVELAHGFENLFLAQIRIIEGRVLNAVFIRERLRPQPAVLQRLARP